MDINEQLQIPEFANEDPRIDLASLKGHRWYVDTTGIEYDDAKIGRTVHLDGRVVGRVWQGGALLAVHGPGAPKAWMRSDSHASDRYASPMLAALAMCSDILLNRCSPDHFPVQDKWRAENELGIRFENGEAFLEWAEQNNYPHKKPGVRNPTYMPVGHITT